MTNVPTFFLPDTTPEQAESVYSELARFCGCRAPDAAERIYSISFKHDGEEWTATVGHQLRGVRVRTSRTRGRTVERKHHLRDLALVLAIFPGIPYLVVTNHRLPNSVGSEWENPFRVGNPHTITNFRLTE